MFYFGVAQVTGCLQFSSINWLFDANTGVEIINYAIESNFITVTSFYEMIEETFTVFYELWMLGTNEFIEGNDCKAGMLSVADFRVPTTEATADV